MAIARAAGDTLVGSTFRNSCGDPVKPLISIPTPGVAVVIETDPTGQCSGSNPPGSLSVLLASGNVWKLSTSTTGSGFRTGVTRDGHPDIIVQYPPFQRDCPVLGWNGSRYVMTKTCGGSPR